VYCILRDKLFCQFAYKELTSVNSISKFLQEDGLSLDGDKWHWVVGIMVSVTLVKLFLVLYCRSFTNEIVKAFAQDHFFDVITNSIGLIAAILASTLYWWIDPAGAIVVSSSLTFFFTVHSLQLCTCYAYLFG